MRQIKQVLAHQFIGAVVDHRRLEAAGQPLDSGMGNARQE